MRNATRLKDLLSIPIPFSDERPSRIELCADALTPLLLLVVAGALVYGAILIRADWASLSRQTLALLAVGLVQFALAELWEIRRLWPASAPDAPPLIDPGEPPVRIASAGLSWLLLLIYAGLLGWRSGLQPAARLRVAGLLLALLLAGAALVGLQQTRQRWRRQHQQQNSRRPEAHALPSRKAHALPSRSAKRRSLRCDDALEEDAGPRLILGLLLAYGLLWLAGLGVQGRWNEILRLLGALLLGALLLEPLLLGALLYGARPRPRRRSEAHRDNKTPDRGPGRGGQECERWSAADFIGLYVLLSDVWRARDDGGPDELLGEEWQLWLARDDGGPDELLAVLPGPLNRRGVDSESILALAERLSRASGLPLLYDWPEEPPAQSLANL